MNFAEAMQHVLDGGFARRANWNRPAYIRRTDSLAFSRAFEWIAMVMKDKTFGPYTPSNCDMLATDWEIVK